MPPMRNRPTGSAASRSGNPFERAGFTRSAGATKKRLIIGVDGVEKSGKSHFALTAPEPVAVINFDIGLDGVVQKVQDDKQVWVKEIRFVMSDFRNMEQKAAAKAADEILVQVTKAYKEVLGEARSIVVDNATELWELVRLSHFGKLEQIKPHHYSQPNNEYREFIRMAYDQDRTSLILLHKVKDEYINNERTGLKKRSGMADTGFLVQANAVCYRVADEAFPDCFHMAITDCRQNAELANTDLSGADLSFPKLASLIFPDTEETFWL